MLKEILLQAFASLLRQPFRSFLTMLGIVWGIVSVTILIAYGNGFRDVLVAGFDAFGKSAVVCWPGQTSEQAGGQRAGKRVRFEEEDLEAVRAAWVAIDVPQCGYCQSGQIMSAAGLLSMNPNPTDEDIDLAMNGNVCRCCTYHRIRAAIHDAAGRMEG